VQMDCPSQRAYVATGDGGYINTSDIEEDDEDDAAVDLVEKTLGLHEHYCAACSQHTNSTF
jgi:hypothetical protein